MRYIYPLAALLATCASGCAVYAPLTPATPILTSPRQVEVQAGVHTPSAVTASVSYTPLPHLLLTATGATNLNSGDTTYFRYQHAEVGAGYYTVLDQKVYLGLLGGYGRTHSRRGYEDLDFLFTYGRGLLRYEARYNRFFAQAYLASVSERAVSWGGSLRATALDFRRLTRNDVPVTQAGRVYLEPTAFLRIGRPTQPLQLQLSAGLSAPINQYRQDTDDTRLTRGTLLLGAALVWRPFWQRRVE